jgi:hypothetical protein
MGNNSRYQRYAGKVLSINGIAALGTIFLCLLMALTDLQHMQSVLSSIVVSIIVVLSLWCFFCLPVSTIAVAVGSWRRIKERKARIFLFYCLVLLTFWLLFLLACVQ